MDLFAFDNTLNLLPYDGTVHYFGSILPSEVSKQYFDTLLNSIAWKNDEAFVYDKHIITKRKVAWYGDIDYSYTYSRKTQKALEWTDSLLALKLLVEEKVNVRFNSCLLNLYHNGDEGVGWHSDDEYNLDGEASIASLTFGAQRKFLFKHKKNKKTVTLELEAGSLLIMKGTTQTYWLHSLPKTKKINEPRINLTFRVMRT